MPKEYLQKERKVFIEDSFKATPEFITEVPGVVFFETKTYIGEKMIEQLESFDPTFKEFIIKLVK